jgi:hypothetical protein
MTDEKQDSDFVQLSDVLPGLFQNMAKASFPTSPESMEDETARKSRAGKKATRASAGLAKTAAEIIARPEKSEAAYLARELVQCTLPHRDPGDVPAWVRRNGNFALVLQPGFDEESMKSVGLPYGSIPRLLMLWIVTEAVKNKNKDNSRRIKLGDTLNDFLLAVGLNPRTGGGKRGDAKRLKEQMLRLFQCRFSFKYSEGNEEKGSKSFVNMELTREAHFWWDFTSPDQTSLFESEIVLGEVFFEAITAHAVPVDFRALKALKQSSFALDLYTWANYRVFRLQDDGQKEVRIPMQSLKEQFGTEYTRADNFKAALIDALAKVQQVFPALDYSIEKNVFVLRDGKGRPAIASRDKEAARKRLAALQPYHQVSRKKRTWFVKNYPHISVDQAINEFDYWINQSGIEVGNPDALFVTFVKKKWPR